MQKTQNSLYLSDDGVFNEQYHCFTNNMSEMKCTVTKMLSKHTLYLYKPS